MRWLDGITDSMEVSLSESPTPGVGDGQGGLACCDSWSRKESDTTERLNRSELKAPVDSMTLLPQAKQQSGRKHQQTIGLKIY